MSDFTRTPHYNLYKPNPSADLDAWGGHLNFNADTLDNALYSATSGGPFLPTGGGTMAGALNVTATGSSVTRAVQDRFADEINLKDWGALGDGSDVSDILIAALATGKNVYMPAGTYRIRKQITVGVLGTTPQRLRGDGKSTYLLVEASFDSAASSIIYLKGAEINGPTVCDLRITCAQPTTATSRTDFVTLGTPGAGTGLLGIKYPPVFLFGDASGVNVCNRFRIERVRMSNCWDGIHQYKNSPTGGWWIRDIEISCYNIGLKLSTTADFCHLHGWHHWYFDQPAANQNVMRDGQVICMQFGVGDDVSPGVQSINVSEVMNFTGKIVINNPLGDLMFSNMMMDGNNAVFDHVQCYWTQINNMYCTCGGTGFPTSGISQINMRGGVCFVSNIFGWAGCPMVTMTGGRLEIAGGQMQANTVNTPVIDQTGGVLKVHNIAFRAATGGWTTAGIVHVGSGGVIGFHNNIFETGPALPADAAGMALDIDVDNAAHSVVGNNWNGWKWPIPYPGTGFYGVNSDRWAVGLGVRDYLNLGQATVSPSFNVNLNTLAGGQRMLAFYTTNVIRWAFGVENAATENMIMLRYDNSGVLQVSPTRFYRDGTTQLCRSGLRINWDLDYPNMQPGSSGWGAIRTEANAVSPYWEITACGTALLPSLIQRRSRGPVVDDGTPSLPAAVQANDVLGRVSFRGYDGSAWSDDEAIIQAIVQAPWTTSAHPTTLGFYTTDLLTTTLAMQISRSQNVLIGLDTTTESIGVRLQVQGSAKTSAGLSCFGVTPPAARPSVTGSRGGNAALAALLTAIAATGIITDGTTA